MIDNDVNLMSNKLELTWYSKEKEISVEPRILIENKDLSHSNEPGPSSSFQTENPTTAKT